MREKLASAELENVQLQVQIAKAKKSTIATYVTKPAVYCSKCMRITTFLYTFRCSNKRVIGGVLKRCDVRLQ